jgi:HPt (histidine-containing phosphotransfer) domain-containing protein
MRPREPAAANDDVVLDEERLLAITGGSRPAARELLAMLVEDGVSLVTQIRAAAGRRDPDAVRDAAHALKGIAGNVGAPCLERAARAIETCAIGDAAMTTALAALEGAFTAVAAGVRAFGRPNDLAVPC